jgi:hypothetical protein
MSYQLEIVHPLSLTLNNAKKISQDRAGHMSSIVVLEWRFSPSDYFEPRNEIKQNEHTIIVVNDKAQVSIDSEVYDANPSIREVLHKALNVQFFGVMLYTHKPYELSTRPSMTTVHPDGSKDVEISANIRSVSSAKAYLTVINKDGIVVVDAKQDLINKAESLADLYNKHQTDEFFMSLFRSYEASVRDQKDELVHLYEIRDALHSKFGNDKTALSALKFPKKDWDNFGKLCNQPLKQGRHRGKKYEALRDATTAELSDARRIALAMIEAYDHYIDRSGGL